MGDAGNYTVDVTYDGVYLPLVQLNLPGAILGDTDRAARFVDTGDAKVVVEYDLDLNPPRGSPFSVEAWALVEGGAGTKRAVITSLDDFRGDEKYGYEIAATAGNRWRFSTGRFNPGEVILEGPAIVPLEWTHLVAVYDGSSNELYVNGYPAGGAANPDYDSVPSGFPVPLFIGASGSEATNGVGDSFFDGLIDEVAFYNTALSQADVLEHYAAGLPGDAPPEFILEPGDVLSDIGGQVTFDVAGNVVTSAVGTLTVRPPSIVLLENFETYATGLFGPVAATNWVLDAAVRTNCWTIPCRCPTPDDALTPDPLQRSASSAPVQDDLRRCSAFCAKGNTSTM